MRTRLPWAAALLLGLASGCSDFLGLANLTATPFILSGTMAVEDRGGPCPAWLGENGVKYYLFQGDRLTNDEFDRIRVDGVTSRLEIKVRTDLVVECASPRAEIVEVQRVLEILD
jgi:hypothetical protein